uniref:UPAR/Ly6 domain-containing protein n=1 Tax=Steinernema glaseri TaxID=37863 RepID=A0A1I7YSJ8_9BILA
MTCGAQAYSCYKFVCAGPQFYIQKGCMDPQNPQSLCQHMQGECQGRQGYGQCYTCQNRWCNGASSTALSLLAAGVALLSAFSFRL